MTSAITRGLLLAVLLVAPAAAQTTGTPASQRPPCEAAPDDEYGYTRERPIQVGGSPVYGAARQRRYLESLRGPEGQPVTYRRTGQDRAPDGTILDAYQVNYEGREKPITLFLDCSNQWRADRRRRAVAGALRDAGRSTLMERATTPRQRGQRGPAGRCSTM